MVEYLRDVSPRDLAPLIDHTNLMPTATEQDIAKLCQEATEYRFTSVCIMPSRVPYAVERLWSGSVAVCTVVGFPLGATDSATKAFEAIQAVKSGAREIDMVVNNGFLSEQHIGGFYNDIATVAQAVYHAGGTVLKCILEAGYLTPEQLREATEAVVGAASEFPDVHFYTKTSTGMALDKLLVDKHGSKVSGARPEDLQEIARIHASYLELSLGIKASGGIRTFDDAIRSLEAMGARTKEDLTPERYRLGTSASISIVS